MCWACNPMCGRCKPPRKRGVLCPECGKMGFFSKEECLDGAVHTCPSCGADLTAQVHVEPVFCVRVEGLCAYPCKSNEMPASTEGFECKYRTLAVGTE